MIIEGQKLRQAILTALADKEMVKILDCATNHAISVNDIIKQTDIPHTTAYRKIKWMLEEGLLLVEKIHITLEGKKFSLFRSVIKSVTVRYDQSKITVEADYNVDVQAKTAERFFSLES